MAGRSAGQSGNNLPVSEVRPIGHGWPSAVRFGHGIGDPTPGLRAPAEPAPGPRPTRFGSQACDAGGMARVDYFNDPNAPKANSIVPSVTVVALNDAEEVLLIHKTDNDLWALPGGGVDVGESVADAAVRETKEETGFDVEVTGLIGLYTNPAHVIAYDDGEVRQQFSMCFTARIVGGELRTSSESKEVAFVAPSKLDELNIHPSMRLRIDHGLANQPKPYIG